jgi:cytochrome b
MPAHSTPSTIAVWDLPTRLFHWLLVLCVALLYLSGDAISLAFRLPLPGGGQWVMGNMDVHMLLGQVVLGLVTFRLIWGFIGSSTARFATFVQGPHAVLEYLRAIRRGELPLTVGHNPAGALMIVALLALLATQASTGLFANDDIFSEGPLAKLVSSSTSNTLTAVHGLVFNVLLLAIIIHVGAAVYYRLRGKNLIQSMVTGRKPADLIPTTAETPRLVSPLLAIPAAAIAAAAIWALVTLL